MQSDKFFRNSKFDVLFDDLFEIKKKKKTYVIKINYRGGKREIWNTRYAGGFNRAWKNRHRLDVVDGLGGRLGEGPA